MNYLLYFLLIFVCGIYIFEITNVVTYYLQVNGYNHACNARTLIKKVHVDILLIYLSPALVSLGLNILLYHSKILWLFILVEIIAFFTLILILNCNKPNRKVQLKITKRYVRIYAVCFVISAIITCYICHAIVFKYNYLFSLVYLVPLIVSISVLLAGMFLWPIECIINLYYINSASKILSNHGGIVNIAITGSYGKTSTKFMLKTILSQKYNVVATPNSFNTPLGISRTIREILTPSTDIFIMEFGAKRKGEIKYLCNKYKPNIGIITAIGKAHINTFKNIDNIISAKSELIENLYGANKYAVFNIDNEYVNKCVNKFMCLKLKCGNGGDIYASNIKCTQFGTQFDVIKNGELYVHLKTKLIGAHNISNILLCVGVAIRLRLSKQQIINGVAAIDGVKARMEVIPHSSGAIIINDGYNSNPDSARCAIDALLLYKNRTKIVLTPGMVELGKLQEKENYDFGKYMATKVDRVYIANETNARALTKGLIDGGMSISNIKTNCNFSDTYKSLTANDVLLIENDLPDNYN